MRIIAQAVPEGDDGRIVIAQVVIEPGADVRLFHQFICHFNNDLLALVQFFRVGMFDHEHLQAADGLKGGGLVQLWPRALLVIAITDHEIGFFQIGAVWIGHRQLAEVMARHHVIPLSVVTHGLVILHGIGLDGSTVDSGNLVKKSGRFYKFALLVIIQDGFVFFLIIPAFQQFLILTAATQHNKQSCTYQE